MSVIKDVNDTREPHFKIGIVNDTTQIILKQNKYHFDQFRYHYAQNMGRN